MEAVKEVLIVIGSSSNRTSKTLFSAVAAAAIIAVAISGCVYLTSAWWREALIIKYSEDNDVIN